MTPHKISEGDESEMVLPATDSESDLEEDAESVDEETAKKWISTTYERGSKSP